MIEQAHFNLRAHWRLQVGTEPSKEQLALVTALWAEEAREFNIHHPHGPFLATLKASPYWKGIMAGDPDAVAATELDPTERVRRMNHLRRQQARLLIHPMMEG